MACSLEWQIGYIDFLYGLAFVILAAVCFAMSKTVVRDITRRKQAEEALKESEDKYRTIFETTGTATVILEEDTTISLANLEAEKLSGYSKEELEGKKSWMELVAKDDLEIMKEYHRLRRIDPNYAPRNYEFRLIDRKGDVKDILLTVDMIPGTKKSVASFLDITERKKTEKAFRESEARLNRITDNMLDMISQTDIEWVYQYVSPSHKDVLGYDPVCLLGKSVFEFVHPDDLETVLIAVKRGIETKMPGKLEYRYRHASGHYLWLETVDNLLFDNNGQITGAIFSGRDITERKRAEETLAAERNRFETLTEQAPFGMGLIDREGTCKYINPKFIEIFGYNLDDIPNLEEWFRKAYPDPEYRQKVISTWKDDIKNTMREKISRIFTVTCKDGKKKIIRFTPVRLQTGEYLITCEDFTQRKQLEKELLLIGKAIESTGNAVIMTDKKGINLIYQNNSLVNLLGYTVEELNAAGGAPIIYFNPDTARDVYRTIISGHSWKGDLELRTRDNRIIPVYLHGDAVRDETGEIVGIFGIYTDITDRKLAEEKLKAANQHLLDIIDFLPDATFVVDRDKKVIAWNRAIEEITGVRKEEILGKGDYAYAFPFYGKPRPILIDLIFSENRDAELKYEYFERKENTIYAEGFTPSVFNGEGAYMWGKASPLFDNEGNIIGAIESMRDITERKKAEEALRSSEERFATIFNASPSIMSISTLAEGRFINVNEYFLHIMGYRREEVIGRTATDISIWVNPERAEIIKILREEGKVNNLECILRKKSGEVYIGLYSAEIVLFDGEQFILSVVNDITERKRLEEEMARLERLNLVGEMAAGIGHEIRNPMTTVRGFLQLLGSKTDCIQYKEYYDLMIEELDRANLIITEFLSLAKNKAVIKKAHTLNSIVETLSPLIQADAIRADKYIEVELEDTPDLLLDEKEIRQLILNLVRNGLEAMSPGGNITIKTFRDGQNVVLAVRDQGKGIEPDVLEKIGTPFFTTKDSGTGLGLAVCYSIAARHEATIEVETGPTGTTFYVRFRLPNTSPSVS